MANILNIYKKIDLLRKRFHQSARKKESLLTLISEAEVSEQVYNSNAIENSTLSLDETEKILLKIDLDRFISERELFEAKNLARVVTYINREAKQKELTLDMVLFLHKMLISNIRDEIAGRFRQENEWVRVGNHIACDPKQVIDKLEEMFISYHANPIENIIKRIAVFHLNFENIHPFVDGNGRIGRVLNNCLLIREGYVPINIKFIDRSDYYNAFQEFDEKSSSSIMEEIVGKAMTNSYHKRLAYLNELEIITLNKYAKRNNISHSNLINKAKRQTIEAFYEKGIWKIGMPQ
ncbi:MAG: Fic family protein [Candidatus Marinimicrobia bacterium]|nr:Fic family protein [Candidatus Neomarinimicrobiota bacterium]MBL7010811.1 Fic family protein [Candidatus Neomarinimicrobiota bacterium]MBL7031005.1 Fic family protein [Candidatus Neomarinimicrobiota bacterium]